MFLSSCAPLKSPETKISHSDSKEPLSTLVVSGASIDSLSVKKELAEQGIFNAQVEGLESMNRWMEASDGKNSLSLGYIKMPDAFGKQETLLCVCMPSKEGKEQHCGIYDLKNVMQTEAEEGEPWVHDGNQGNKYQELFFPELEYTEGLGLGLTADGDGVSMKFKSDGVGIIPAALVSVEVIRNGEEKSVGLEAKKEQNTKNSNWFERLLSLGVTPVEAAGIKQEKMSTPTTAAEPTATIQPTSEPSPTVDVVLQTREKMGIISPEAWQNIGLPAERINSWLNFQNGGSLLESTEMEVVGSVVDQLIQLKLEVNESNLNQTQKENLGYRVKMFEDSIEGEKPVVYLVDNTVNEGQNLYLKRHVLRGGNEVVSGFYAAPILAGMEQSISPDGKFVIYTDAQGRQMYGDSSPTVTERGGLLVFSRAGSTYKVEETNLRIQYPELAPLLGDIYFYKIEDMTESQRFLIKDALLKMLNDFPGIEKYLQGGAYVYGKEAKTNFTSGDWVLFTLAALSKGKDYLIGVIAHERLIHVHDNLNGDTGCSIIHEIGNGKIPDGFFSWSWENLLEVIDSGTNDIGAYHISAWFANYYHLDSYIKDFYVYAILNRKYPDGRPIYVCGR
jgi:hypothetical protein